MLDGGGVVAPVLAGGSGVPAETGEPPCGCAAGFCGLGSGTSGIDSIQCCERYYSIYRQYTLKETTIHFIVQQMMIVTKEQKKTLRFLSATLFFESWIIGTVLGVAFLSIAGWLVFWQSHQNRVLPAVAIEGVDVGGLSKDEAIQTIQSELPELEVSVVFTYIETELQTDSETNEEQQVTLDFSDLEVSYDYEKAVEKALSVGRESSALQQFRTITKLAFVPYQVKAPVTYASDKVSVAISELENQIYISPTYPRATIEQSGNEETISLETGAYGRELDLDYVNTMLLKKLQHKQNTSVNLNDSISRTGYILNEIEQQQALESAKALTGVSIIFDMPEFVQTPVVKTFELDDTQLISLLSFPTGYDIDQIDTILESWNEEVSVPVAEPKLQIETTESGTKRVTEFEPPQEGLEIDTDQARAQIIDVLEKQRNNSNTTNNSSEDSAETNQNEDETNKTLTITLPFLITSPSTDLASLNDLGIKESIGFGISHYRGSIPNRALNVGLTAQKINNYLIAPGEEFSFNRAVGPISGETGFRSAYVIKDGRTVLGDGGGVCQVSTTLFRAALDAGLEITRRLQHSYRVGYYEQNTKPGLDATVYSGNVDLRFKNDTENYILMHNTIDASNMVLTTEFFGTSDGRSTEIISHDVWDERPAPAPQYFPDPNLEPGKTVQVDWAVGGVKTRVKNEIRDASGEVVRVDEYYSNYIPWSAKYAVGE
jgi:vancomycin resistance protein YoaR